MSIRVKVGSHLRSQNGEWYCHVQVPKDVQNVIKHEDGSPRGSWTVKLHTRDQREAELKKLVVIGDCGAQIEDARRRNRGEVPNPENMVDDLKQSFEHYGAGRHGAEVVAQRLKQMGADPANRSTQILYAEATGRFTKTTKHLSKYLDWKGYADDVDARPVLEDWCRRHPYFDTVTQDELQRWVNAMMNGEAGYGNKIKHQTARKKVSYVKKYWEWCYEQKHTSVKNLAVHGDIMPTANTTKKARQAENTSYRPYSVEECWMLHRAAVEDGYKHLDDLILLGMYTGCRIGELCEMRVEEIGKDYFQVSDGKTYSSKREIPIHKDIQQTVERLIQTSADGYLFSELSDPTVKRVKNKRYKGISQKFGRLKAKFGFGRRYGFHSFRATLANRFENAQVDVNFAARIIGHAVPNMTYGLYSGKIDWANAVGAMEKIAYPKP